MTESQPRFFSDAKKMPFFAHFNEIRKRLTQFFIVFFVLALLFYWAPINEFIAGIIFRDVIPHLPNGQFALMGPFDAFTFRLTIGVYGALIITLPLLIYHVLAFFAPAIKRSERKWIFPSAFAAGILFITGILFAYFLILPHAVEWLLAQHTAYTFEIPRGQEWLSGVAMLLIGFGISFELPLIVFALIGLGIISYPAVREAWRIVYVAMVFLAAIITPDRGPVTMVALAVALVILYEGGMLAARLFLSQKVDEQYADAYDDMIMYDNEPSDDPDKLAKRKKLTKKGLAAKKRIEARAANNPQEASQGDEQ